MQKVTDRKRVFSLFKELVSIDSESFSEREFADVLLAKLKELGIEAHEDDSGKKSGSNAGNVYGYLEGTIEGEPLLFCAHMDTVSPGKRKIPVIDEEGRITSKGDTVLGADDVAGITEILEAVRILKENNIPHRSLEFLFPVAEEAYVKGSRLFDYTKFASKQAYVLDLTGSIGTASLKEPSLISFKVRINGKGAHAGFAPEEGINAIQVFAESICSIKQGHVDGETTVNIGKVSGGTAINAVPAQVTAEGEIRSYVHEKAVKELKHIKEIFEASAKKYGASIEMEEEVNLVAYEVPETSPAAVRFKKACKALNIRPVFTKTFGGSDNNSFLRNGITGIVMACAMEKVHTTEEYCEISKMVQCIEILLKLMMDKK